TTLASEPINANKKVRPMPFANAGATLKPRFNVRAVSKRPIGSFTSLPFLRIFPVVLECAN
ncbi:MAG: hypothetical protein RLZZ62_1137, partial [Actinomycetota bacterium]